MIFSTVLPRMKIPHRFGYFLRHHVRDMGISTKPFSQHHVVSILCLVFAPMSLIYLVRDSRVITHCVSHRSTRKKETVTGWWRFELFNFVDDHITANKMEIWSPMGTDLHVSIIIGR